MDRQAMKMRWLGRGVLLVVAGSVWACSSDATEMLADAMIDGAAILHDATTDSAHAQTTVTVPCEEVTRIATGDPAVENAVYFAEHRDPSIDPDAISDVEAILCGLEAYTDVRYLQGVPLLQCATPASATRGIEIEPGRIRVMCGALNVRTGTSTPTMTDGRTFRTVRFRYSL